MNAEEEYEHERSVEMYRVKKLIQKLKCCMNFKLEVKSL